MAASKKPNFPVKTHSRRKIFPPRRKDWRPGVWQVGIFMRSPEGDVIEYVRNEAPKEAVEGASKLFRRLWLDPIVVEPTKKTTRYDHDPQI